MLDVAQCGAGTGAQGKADATWIFLGHEGVQAEMEGVRLNVFKLSDYSIPYGFTPILIGNPETMRSAWPSCCCYCGEACSSGVRHDECLQWFSLIGVKTRQECSVSASPHHGSRLPS